MSCSSERIERLLDGELLDGDAAELEQHLAGCADCSAALARAALQKSAVRAAGRRFAPRAEFRQAMMRTLAAEKLAAEPAAFASVASRGWLALAATLVIGLALGLLGAFALSRSNDRAAALTELVDIHTLTLASANPVDVVSTDRHTVKPWFEGRVPLSLDLPELPQSGELALVGGRVAWIRGTAAAQILIRDRQHRLSLFVMPVDSAAGRAFRDGQDSRNGIRFRVWHQGDRRSVLVGDLAPEEMAAIAKRFGSD